MGLLALLFVLTEITIVVLLEKYAPIFYSYPEEHSQTASAIASSSSKSSAPFSIKTNRLLASEEPEMPLDMAKLLREGMAKKAGTEACIRNAALTSGRYIDLVNHYYGPSGLHRHQQLMLTHGTIEYKMYLSVQKEIFSLLENASNQRKKSLSLDNDRLLESKEISNLRCNVFQPSLSRKIYNAGNQFGSITYGLGGPKILVSHPFRGGIEEAYGVYEDSQKVVKRLIRSGFHGRFLFLDNFLRLDKKINGYPTWLLWFSLAATHSDLVLYVVPKGVGLSDSQKLEVAYTPNFVQKKIVEIEESNFLPQDKFKEVIILRDGKQISSEQMRAIEEERMGDMISVIDVFSQGSPNRNFFFVLSEDSTRQQYPSSYRLFV